MNKSCPYLSNPDRLADVIAAIQVMGTYKFYKLDFATWADRISADQTKADYWQNIFIQHPEFFRLDNKREKASLVWRRQYPKRFDIDKNAEITKEQFYALSDEAKLRVSRIPLESGSIESLIKTAVDLHTRALQHQQDKRWWIPLIATFIGGLIGAVLGGLFK
jgi:hypothetical protein